MRTDQSSTRDRGGWAHHVLVDDTYSMKPANLQDVSVNMRCGCELASRRGWPGRPTDRLGRDPRSYDLGRVSYVQLLCETGPAQVLLALAPVIGDSGERHKKFEVLATVLRCGLRI